MKKKLTSILALCVMFSTLTLPVSASQAAPEEQQQSAHLSAIFSTFTTPASISKTLSQTILEKAQQQLQECELCGEMTMAAVRLAAYETGPFVEPCAHGYPYGDDLITKKFTTYQHQCSNDSCLYRSEAWDTFSGAETDCHGHR